MGVCEAEGIDIVSADDATGNSVDRTYSMAVHIKAVPGRDAAGWNGARADDLEGAITSTPEAA